MPRAFDDKTSRCRDCTFWEAGMIGMQDGPGFCNWVSVPAWVAKNFNVTHDHYRMNGSEGAECWQLNKRPAA